ncbi:MAG: hypothetical protein P4L92_23390 [Rudaea sp.]|nr:hypothetical protein [Rudaea sp.]
MFKRSAMRYSSIAALALLCIGFCSLTTAQQVSAPAGKPAFNYAAVQKARNSMQAQIAAGRDAAKSLGANSASTSAGAQPAETFVNVDRAYPPSCLNSPLAFGMYANDPNAIQAQITLYGDPLGDSTEAAYSEVDTITLFRVPCSAGTSATLLEIDRPSGTTASLYPIFPNISVQQGNNNLYIRLTDDPNTFFATVYSFSPIFASDVYVLENIYGGATQFDYNDAFTLTVDNLNTNDSAEFTTFNLAAYNPAQYPAASQPLPISGYMSTNWSSQTQTAEGIVLQVYDNRDGASRTLAFAWFTYDDLGLPFWLYGQASFTIGGTSVTAQTVYFTNGTFAGTTSNVAQHNWGTVTFTFPDCAHMNIVYNGDASAVNGPKGSGSAQFVRVADVNGLVCQ